jgi:valyl-tRNA synthetase
VEWKEHHHARIVEQMNSSGARSTGAAKRSRSTSRARARCAKHSSASTKRVSFYRGDYIVNWCPLDQTAISDEEVQYDERDSKLYWVSTREARSMWSRTTRPETILGDTAVAVRSRRSAKQHLIGKTCTVPLVNRVVPIVADDVVQMEFGSGFVKVHAAHDLTDFGIGQRTTCPRWSSSTAKAA